MNLGNMVKLLGEVSATPVVVLGCVGVGCRRSLAQIAVDLIRDDVESWEDITPPSVASWLGLDYESMMSLFYMQPVGQPQCTRLDLKRAAAGKCRAFDALPDELRKAAMMDVIGLGIAIGEIDWHKALAAYGIESAA